MIRKNIFEKRVFKGAYSAVKLMEWVVEGLLDEINNCEPDDDGNFKAKIKLPKEIDDYIDNFGEWIDDFDGQGWESDGWGDKEYVIDEEQDIPKNHNTVEHLVRFCFKKSGDVEFTYRHDEFYEINFDIWRDPYKHNGEVHLKGKLNKSLTPPKPHTIGGWTGRRKKARVDMML